MYGRGYPRDKDQLLKEVDVVIKLSDINRLHQMKARLAPQWWEPVLLAILFSSALGLIASLLQYVDVTQNALDTWVVFWFTVMILSMIMSFQVVLVKIYNFRRANEHLMRMMEQNREALTQIQDTLLEMKKGDAASTDEKSAVD